jgi:hypothetical protein
MISRRNTLTAALAKGAAKEAAAPLSKAAAPAKKAAAPAKKAVPPEAAPQTTITLKHIAAELAEGMTRQKKGRRPGRFRGGRHPDSSSRATKFA